MYEIQILKIFKTETILKNKYLRFKVDDFETGNGVAGKYWSVDNPKPAVVVIEAWKTSEAAALETQEKVGYRDRITITTWFRVKQFFSI